jgi:gliding motility-associated lipoprotein GldH
MKNKTRITLFAICSCFLFSCSDDTKVIDELVNFESGQWDRTEILKSTLTVTDTSQLYDIRFFIRHEIDYGYYNLFTNVKLSADTTTIISKTTEYNLFDPISGSPESESTFITGKKMGGQYDHEYPLYDKIRFKEVGDYTIEISQMMRDEDALKGINAIGLKVYTTE